MTKRQCGGGKRPTDRHKGKIPHLFLLCVLCCLLPSVVWADTVYSRAAVVMDAATGKLLYAKNPHLRCLPASTTKLMTAILAIERLNLMSLVKISANASRVAPHKAGFKEGEQVTVEELLYASLLSSANDASVALAEAVAGTEERFVELMNEKAALIGAHDTHFINANGLPGFGQYITASDLSKIMQYALRYPKLRQIINTRVTEISTEQGRPIFLRNTNRLLWSEDGLIGGKTGFTRGAGHCFVCAAERDDDAVIVALLGSPSRNDLWRETGLLIGRGFDILSNGKEPIVYLAKGDTGSSNQITLKSKKAHIKKAKKGKKRAAIVAKHAKSKKKTLVATKKSKGNQLAKHKVKKRNFRLAKKGKSETQKG